MELTSTGAINITRMALVITPMIPPKETIRDATTKITPQSSSKPRNGKYAFFIAVKLATIEFNPDARDSDANPGARPNNGNVKNTANDTNKPTILATIKDGKYFDANPEIPEKTINTKATSAAEMSVCT